jgi:hypothetical protein
MQLYSKIYVGSNQQPFELILDTGSAVNQIINMNVFSGLGYKANGASPALLGTGSIQMNLRLTKN